MEIEKYWKLWNDVDAAWNKYIMTPTNKNWKKYLTARSVLHKAEAKDKDNKEIK